MLSRRLFLSMMLVAMPAFADLLQVAVSGTFDSSTTVTDLTAPSATWAITFDIDSQPTLSPWVPDTFLALISNLEFDLDGAAVSGTTVNAGVVFNDVAAGGDFSIGLLDTPGDDVSFQFSGSRQAFSGSLGAPEIVPGTFDIGTTGLFINGRPAASPTTSSIVITDLSPVPEPHATLLLGTVLCGAGLLLRRRRSAAPREESKG
jgi:hypothetical protein